MTLAPRLAMALSVTQVIGWATAFNALALLARPIASELNMSLPLTFAGSSVFLVAMAFASRAIVPLYARTGAGPVLVAGSVLMAIGFVAVACATGVASFALGWILLGIAGACALTAPAHALIVQAMGAQAKRWIAAVMLISGLGGAIGLPATALILHVTDWRGTLVVFAALHLCLCLPLHLLASRMTPAPRPRAVGASFSGGVIDQRMFWTLTLATSLIGFVTWGFAIVIVELLQECGLTQTQAVTAAACIGVATVMARGVEFLFAPSLLASETAVWATTALCLSFAVLATGNGLLAAWTFVLLFGAASGTMSIARATLPLELFDPDIYAQVTGRIALPMTLSFAAAPIVFGMAIARAGANGALILALICGLLALIALVALRQRVREKRRA